MEYLWTLGPMQDYVFDILCFIYNSQQPYEMGIMIPGLDNQKKKTEGFTSLSKKKSHTIRNSRTSGLELNPSGGEGGKEGEGGGSKNEKNLGL